MPHWHGFGCGAVTPRCLFSVVAFLWSTQGVIVLRRQPDHLYRNLSSFGEGKTKIAANVTSTEASNDRIVTGTSDLNQTLQSDEEFHKDYPRDGEPGKAAGKSSDAEKAEVAEKTKGVEPQDAEKAEVANKTESDEPQILVGNHSKLDSAGVGSNSAGKKAKKAPEKQTVQDEQEYDHDFTRDGEPSVEEAAQMVKQAEKAHAIAKTNFKYATKNTTQEAEHLSAHEAEAKEAADELAAAEEQLQSASSRKAEQSAKAAEEQRELEVALKQDTKEKAELANAEEDLRGAAKEVARATGAVAERLEEKEEEANQTKVAKAEHAAALESYEQAVKEVEEAEATLAKAEKELKEAKGVESTRDEHDSAYVLSCTSTGIFVATSIALSWGL